MAWTQEYVNNLPDESFAYVEAGGQKDGQGKTVPRSLRHLEYKDESGKVDASHLRNALARLPQTDIPLEAKRQAFTKLAAAAKDAGVEIDPQYRKNHSLADPGLLKIPFFREGAWKHPVYGEIKADRRFLGDMVQNFRDGVLGRPVFVRLGHDAGGKGTYGDVPAEGWVKDIQEQGGVLQALAEPTTPEATELVKSGRYRFASAEYEPNYVDKETGKQVGPVVTAIALTNEPFLTRLPQAVVLSDPPGTIYLDFEEVKTVEADKGDVGKKLAEGFNKFLETLGIKTGAPLAGGGMSDEERQKLAEIETVKKELEATKARLAVSESTSWNNQVERRLADLVSKGIPPIMCEQAKVVLLANPAAATTMVKLADGKEASMADQIFGVLEGLPEEHRIKMAQRGHQESTPPGKAPTAKSEYGGVVPELQKAADTDAVRALADALGKALEAQAAAGK